MPTNDELLNISSQLGQAVLEQGHWNNALQNLADVFGGTFATFEVINKKTGHHIQHQDCSAIEIQENYLGYYTPLNPRIAYGNRPNSPRILHDGVFISERDMDRHEFYADFLSRYDLRYFLSFKALETQEQIGVFTIQKDARCGPPSDEDLNALTALSPVLSNVAGLQTKHFGLLNKLDEFEQFAEVSDKGVVILDENGLVKQANPVAEAVFRANDGITVSHGKIVCRDARIEQLLKSALFSREVDLSGLSNQHQFLVPRSSGLLPYQLTAFVFHKQTVKLHTSRFAVLIIHDPNRTTVAVSKAVAEFYGLTPAETSVACSIAAGKTAGEIAVESNVTVATIRTQIQRVMQKMSVNRQSDIIRILSGYN